MTQSISSGQDPCRGEAAGTNGNADGRNAKPVEQSEEQIGAAYQGQRRHHGDGESVNSEPGQIAIVANSSTPRLWLKLKLIQARHMSVPPRDSLRAELAIVSVTEGSAGTSRSRVAQIQQSVNGMQPTQYAEY